MANLEKMIDGKTPLEAAKMDNTAYISENTKRFIELVSNNPDLPIVPMVDGELFGGNEYARWMGTFGISRIDEFIVDDWYGDGCVRYKSDHDDDTIIEGISEMKYGDCTVDENWEKAKADLEKMWIKAIIVNIDMAD